MSLPLELRTALDEAYQVVLRHPQHALPPFYRKRIYQAFGMLGDPHCRRVLGRLGIGTVRWALLHVPHDESPSLSIKAVLDMVAATVRGAMSRESARAEATQLQQEVDVLQSGVEPISREEMFAIDWSAPGAQERFRPLPMSPARSNYFMLLGAAVMALWEAASGPDLDEIQSPEQTDADIDPWSSDTGAWITQIYAGGVWEPDSDSLKRQEFWTWWLQEALPAAWEQAQMEG